MDRYDPVFAPVFRRRVRRHKATRAEIRQRTQGKKRTRHGGRGRKYGIKGLKNPRH